RGGAQPYSPRPGREGSRVRVALNHLRGTQPRRPAQPDCTGGKAMRRISAWVLLAASVLVAVPTAAGQAQPPPKTLRIAVGIDADTLDPAGQTTTTVANMVDYIYETLLRPDYARGTVAPQLATSWTVSRD